MFYIIHKLTLGGWFSLGSGALLSLSRKLKFLTDRSLAFISGKYIARIYLKPHMNFTINMV